MLCRKENIFLHINLFYFKVTPHVYSDERHLLEQLRKGNHDMGLQALIARERQVE